MTQFAYNPSICYLYIYLDNRETTEKRVQDDK